MEETIKKLKKPMKYQFSRRRSPSSSDESGSPWSLSDVVVEEEEEEEEEEELEEEGVKTFHCRLCNKKSQGKTEDKPCNEVCKGCRGNFPERMYCKSCHRYFPNKETFTKMKDRCNYCFVKLEKRREERKKKKRSADNNPQAPVEKKKKKDGVEADEGDTYVAVYVKGVRVAKAFF